MMQKIDNGVPVPLNHFRKITREELAKALDKKDYRVAAVAATETTTHGFNLYIVIEIDGMLKGACVGADHGKELPSGASQSLSWVNFERELAENHGIRFSGNPWLKPLRSPRGMNCGDEYQFFSEQGDGVHEVAVGPVHAGVIEPGHFRFQCRGEKIDHLEIRLGYQHRGIEALLTGPGQLPWPKRRHLPERIAGDTTVTNAVLFAEVVEGLCEWVVPPRARAIRVAAMELERAALHLSTLSGVANDVAYLTGSAFAGATRTYVINSLQSICGNRFGRGLVVPGGVRFDIDEALAGDLIRTLTMVLERLEVLEQELFNAPDVLSRLQHTGKVTFKEAENCGMTGVTARASGVERDARKFSRWPGYSDPGFTPLYGTPASGDVFARSLRRIQEAKQSLHYVIKLLKTLPAGEIALPEERREKILPDALICTVAEGPRGENIHLAITGNAGELITYKLKDPSFINWLALALSVRNHPISDFPLCNKSFDLSYAGHDL